MFGGLCFMVNNKMCVGVEQERLMVRIDPARYDEAMEKEGCMPMDFTGKVIVVIDDVSNSGKTLLYALKPFLDFHPKKIQLLIPTG